MCRQWNGSDPAFIILGFIFLSLIFLLKGVEKFDKNFVLNFHLLSDIDESSTHRDTLRGRKGLTEQIFHRGKIVVILGKVFMIILSEVDPFDLLVGQNFGFGFGFSLGLGLDSLRLCRLLW